MRPGFGWSGSSVVAEKPPDFYHRTAVLHALPGGMGCGLCGVETGCPGAQNTTGAEGVPRRPCEMALALVRLTWAPPRPSEARQGHPGKTGPEQRERRRLGSRRDEAGRYSAPTGFLA